MLIKESFSREDSTATEEPLYGVKTKEKGWDKVEKAGL